jgi:hypothetical protein
MCRHLRSPQRSPHRINAQQPILFEQMITHKTSMSSTLCCSTSCCTRALEHRVSQLELVCLERLVFVEHLNLGEESSTVENHEAASAPKAALLSARCESVLQTVPAHCVNRRLRSERPWAPTSERLRNSCLTIKNEEPTFCINREIAQQKFWTPYNVCVHT